MKYLLLILCFVPLLVLAQGRRDYENTVAKFMRYYNKNEVKKICGMFEPEYRKSSCDMWNQAMPLVKKDYGKMLSYKYLGVDTTDPEQVRVFKVWYTKDTCAMSLTLSGDKKYLGTFRFKTSSDEIERMLKKVK
jgi:hypothetical protein